MLKSALIVLCLGLGIGCVTTNENPDGGKDIHTSMSISPKLPATKAELNVTGAKNNNSAINIVLKGLVNPGHIVKGAKAYVVWESPVGLGGEVKPQSLGALQLDKNLGAQLKTITPFRSFELFVTAEANPSAAKPTSEK